MEAAKRPPGLQGRAMEWQNVGSAEAERMLTQVICSVGQGNRGKTCCTAKPKEKDLEDDSQSSSTDRRCTFGLCTRGESAMVHTVLESCLHLP